MDEFDWDDLVRWHLQHQRVQEELYQIEALRTQLTQVSAAVGMVGGTPPAQEAYAEAPEDDEDWQ